MSQGLFLVEDLGYGSFAPHFGNSRELSRIKCQSISKQEQKEKKDPKKCTSIISSRGNSKNGMSAALHAMRYP